MTTKEETMIAQAQPEQPHIEAAAPIVEMRHVNKHYRKKKALDDVSLTIGAGQIVGLIGPNGAGKSTLINCLLGQLAYDGEISVLGRKPTNKRHELMQRVSYISDVAILPRWIKVKNAIDYVEGVHPNFSRSRCERFLARTSIDLKSRVKALSKGMVVQLHLALIMAIDAELLILDEPTLGLDIVNRKAFYEQLINDYFDEQRTILICTHQVEEVEHLLSDVLFINQGSIALDSSMEDLQSQFAEIRIAPEQLERAQSFKPLQVKRIFSEHIGLFQGLDADTAQQLGDVRRPSIADIFVAMFGQQYEPISQKTPQAQQERAS